MRDSSATPVFRTAFPKIEPAGFRTASWLNGVAETPEELQPYHVTIPHALAAAATLEPNQLITVLPEREGDAEVRRTYRELFDSASRIAANLRRLGVGPGDRVLLVFPTSYEFIASFLGVQLINAIPVPAYPPTALRVETALDRLGHIARRADVKLCLTAGAVRPILGDLGLRARGLRDVVAAEALDAGAAVAEELRAGPQDAAFIQFTSGSTGNPKGVLLTHANLLANIHAIGQAVRINRRDIVVSWLPLYHDMGLIGTFLFSLYWRLPLVLMPPSAFLRRPARWLRAIHRFRGTLSAAPNFAYGLCVRRVTRAEREGLDLSSWRLALNGGEPVHRRSVEEFLATYAPYGLSPTVMLPVYGLAEAALAVSFPPAGAPPRYDAVDRHELYRGRAVPAAGGASLVSVGTAVPGHTVMVVNERGEAVPERVIGHILVSGKSLMHGYYRDARATIEMLRLGWLWTGDLGYLADGQLYVAGRAKDVIILRGRNVCAEDIERCVELFEGVRPGGCVAFGVYDEAEGTERVVVVCETRLADAAGRARLAEQVRAAVVESCDVVLSDVVLVEAGAIPKTSSGKRQRSMCRERYLSGTLGPSRTGKLGLALLLLRSKLGYLRLRAKRLATG